MEGLVVPRELPIIFLKQGNVGVKERGNNRRTRGGVALDREVKVT